METQQTWENIAPNLVRQRIVIEAVTDHCIGPQEIKAYMVALSKVLNMQPLRLPFAYAADVVGYGGWLHWITSGVHVYSYDSRFTGGVGHILTVDAYTCKPFSVEKAADFTRNYFKVEKIVYKEV